MCCLVIEGAPRRIKRRLESRSLVVQRLLMRHPKSMSRHQPLLIIFMFIKLLNSF
jgi:hypothetical protein